MCGVVLAPRLPRLALAQNVLHNMRYRGSDESRPITRTLSSEGGGRQWTLGHIRLPIQTPSFESGEEGSQPIDLENGSKIAFVGEFFNLGGQTEEEFLRQACRGSEPLKNLLEALHGVDGFWSIIMTSPEGRWAYAITDHLGIKPLYARESIGMICSEPSRIAQAFGGVHSLDPIYLSNCIKFGYDYSGRTAYAGIEQIPPGSLMTIDLSGMNPPRVEKYWDWSKVKTGSSLREDFDEAVYNRVTGVLDEEVALLMSGGLDSWTVYQSARNQGLNKNLRTVSVDLGETEFLPEGVEILTYGPRGVSTAKIVSHMQAPMDLGSVGPQIQLAEAIYEEFISVVLTGDGADELFGGYRRAEQYDSQASDVFCELPYYHFPRLDRVHMRYTQEVRSPFLSPAVAKHALDTPRFERTQKQAVKILAHELGVPDKIILRNKFPLKSPQVIEGGLEYRRNLVDQFIELHQF